MMSYIGSALGLALVVFVIFAAMGGNKTGRDRLFVLLAVFVLAMLALMAMRDAKATSRSWAPAEQMTHAGAHAVLPDGTVVLVFDKPCKELVVDGVLVPPGRVFTAVVFDPRGVNIGSMCTMPVGNGIVLGRGHRGNVVIPKNLFKQGPLIR